MKGNDAVPITVVRFLGANALVGLLIVGVLCYVALQYEGDSSSIAVIAIVGNLAAASLGGLGSILASTRGATPTPVEVTNGPTDPVPTTPQTPSAFAVGDPAAPLKES